MAPTLLSLPVEIRSMILNHVLSCRRGFVRFFNKVDSLNGDVRPARINVNVLLVCRQVYEEGLPILYRVNTFCIRLVLLRNAPVYMKRSSPPPNTQWIMAMPLAGRAAITSIELCLPPLLLITFDRIFQKLDSILPQVKQLVLFFDSLVAGYLSRLE